MLVQALSGWVTAWTREMDPEKLRSYVYLGQAGLGLTFVAAVFWLRNRESGSGFRVREAELRKKAASFKAQDPLGAAALPPKAQTLRLAGISIQGPAHEILGLSPGAAEGEIQKAYRELMKRYHPDLVGRPGTREWKDAQTIAEAINRAKDEMLSRARSKKN